MLYEIMRHIRNFFVAGTGYEGHYEIADGTAALAFAKDGQYVLIEGSVFNDGVHICPLSGLQDEEFDGRITPLAIPKAFLTLAEEIMGYQEKHGEATPYQSESFGGYSYTKAAGGWQEAYRTRLDGWRKI